MEMALEREVLFNHVFPHFSEGTIESQLEKRDNERHRFQTVSRLEGEEDV